MTTRIITGDARTALADIPDGSISCCVTSPPYFNLRDYGTATWDGGGPDCDHLMPVVATSGGRVGDNGRDRAASCGTFHGGPAGQKQHQFRDTCGKCGAVRADTQIGMEPTLAEYVANLVAVFREVRRCLRDDGTLWIVIGDSYAGSSQTGGSGKETITGGKANQQITMHNGKRDVPPGLKPKDLMMVPARVALALQDDGWYLRSDIIWHKTAPMPESVTDRPTSAHEHIFLLTKRKTYYYDADAVREAHADSSVRRANLGRDYAGRGDRGEKMVGRAEQGLHSASTTLGGFIHSPTGRNQRNVWTLGPAPYAQAHFAVFPPEIPRRCILAGSREGDTVLDPFSGAGTTGLVADRLGRHYVGIELNPEYVTMAENRIRNDAPLFAEEIPA